MGFVIDMQILSINKSSYCYNKSQPNFSGHGKPISLKYIVEKRSELLPNMILEKAKEALKNSKNNAPTLMEIHLERYTPLKNCKTIEEVKKFYPEFANIKETVEFKRESVYTKSFKEKTDENFVLNTLKAYWSDLKTMDEIAQDYGLVSRSSIKRALERANFVTYPINYKTLLKSSDFEGNKIIAAKTTAWNTLHPDLMHAKNKHAAQGCKKESYRKAKSESMKQFFVEHPERREQLSEVLKEVWRKCPEIKEAMRESLKREGPYIQNLIAKKIRKEELTNKEIKVINNFYKQFWATHSELKTLYSETLKGYKIN